MLTVPDGSTNSDTRTALGIRPGARPARLKLDTSTFEDVPRSPTLTFPPSPKSPASSRLSSSPIAQSPTSSERHTSRFARRPTIGGRRLPASNKKIPGINNNNRGLYETQKLLSHLLKKLESREQVPDILERAAISAREASGRSKGKGKSKVLRIGHAIAAATQSSIPSSHGDGIGSEDFEDKVVLDEGDWDTAETYDLVEQMRGLFALAERQLLDLFADSGDLDVPILDATPAKNRRKAGRFSSVSPSFSKGSSAAQHSPEMTMSFPTAASRPETSSIPSISGPYLLERTLLVIQSLLTADSLHPIHLFSPKVPPRALQLACLDISSYLYNKGDDETKVRVVSMVIDGWYAMGSMEMRVTEWLEGRVEDLLRRLARERGGAPKKEIKTEWTDPFSRNTPPSSPAVVVPTFAISDDTTDTPPRQPSSGWMRFSPTRPSFPDDLYGLLSIHSLRDASPMAVQIAALIPRILVAISSTLDLEHFKPTAVFRVHRLVSLILNSKPDTALDLLEIIAHSPAVPRRAAAEILATFYPNVIGHNIIARRLAVFDYIAQRTKWDMGRPSALGEDDTENHHFIPWRISAKSEPMEVVRCSLCDSEIHGFAVKCSMCKEIRHLKCYPEVNQGIGEGVYVYEVEVLSHSDSHTTPTTARTPSTRYNHAKFCPALPMLEERLHHGQNSLRSQATHRKAGQHQLFLVNLFNMTLCDHCCQPLWGVAKQAYTCRHDCQRFFHSECLDRIEREGGGQCRAGKHVAINTVSEEGRNPFVISLEQLQASFDRHYEGLPITTEEVEKKGHGEMGVLYGTLWVQQQLIKNGIGSGSLRVVFQDDRETSDPLDLRPVLRIYESYLLTFDKEISPAAADYVHFSGLERPPGLSFLFSEKWLSYITALLRSPNLSVSAEGTRVEEGFLTPQGLPARYEGDKGSDKCYEMLPLHVLIQTLFNDLELRDEKIAMYFLEHLSLTGLVSLPNLSTSQDPQKIQGRFILPLLMDDSPNTGLLVLAIEALLGDLNLTMNEVGLRMMCSRAWPNLLCAHQALEKLGRAVVRWVMSEEDCLREIIKSYASQHRRIPGVRSSPGASKGSVDSYKGDRQQLRLVYVRGWLEALHDLYPDLYAIIAYDQCKLAAESVAMEDLSLTTQEQRASRMAAVTASKMAVMGEAGVLFSTVMGILTKWLEDLGPLADKDVAFRALPRLLSHQPSDSLDIISLSMSTTSEDPADFSRVCRWIRVLASSGVEIPWEILVSLVDQQAMVETSCVDQGGLSLEARLDLVIAVSVNSAAINPEQFADLCAKVGAGVFGEIKSHTSDPGVKELDVLQRAMLLVLRAYGVPIEDLADTSLGKAESQTKQPPSMSKMRQTSMSSNAQFTLSAEMVIAAANLLKKTTSQSALVLDFLWLLLAKGGMVNDAVGFVHQICPDLYRNIWPLVERSVDRRSRARLLLKLLSVNPDPLESMIRAQMEESKEERARARERLTTFVLESSDKSVSYEVSNWRDSIVGLILMFFEVLLNPRDSTPEDTIILKSLLPSHLTAMSVCFEEHLIKSSDERRLTLLTTLSKLRMTLPQWGVISWATIDELLAEETASINQFKPALSQIDTGLGDVHSVTYSLVSLGLEMLASGVPISWISAQRFAHRVKPICSTPWQSPEVFKSIMIPALRSVLDSPARIIVSGDTYESKTKNTALVGSLFVNVVIEFGDDLENLDYLFQRTLLDTMMVAFFKQSILPIQRQARIALFKIADFVAISECSENRLLALQILQTAVMRVEKEAIVRAIPLLFGTIAGTLVEETKAQYRDPAVIEQSQSFLRSIMKSFGRSGLYLQLFLNDNVDGKALQGVSSLGKAFQILHTGDHTESDSPATSYNNVFRDLLEAARRPRPQLEIVLRSFSSFAESLELELSEDAAQDYCSFLGRLSKNVVEYGSDFDPDPILGASAKVLSLSPSASTAYLVGQISTVLHLCMGSFDVKSDPVLKILQAAEWSTTKAGVENQVTIVLSEVAGAAIAGLPGSPVTLHTILEFITRDTTPDSSSQSRLKPWSSLVLSDAATGCVNILLKLHPVFNSASMSAETLLGILTHSGTLLCQAETKTPGVLSRNMIRFTLNPAELQLHFFLFLFLSSLDIRMGPARSRLHALYPILSRATALCLRASADYMTLRDPEANGSELISLVFMVFRLAVLAVHDGPLLNRERQGSEAEDDAINIMWSRVWPEWSRLLTLSYNGASINGGLRSVTQTVFLDLIIFLGNTQSSLLLRHSETFLVTLGILRYQESASTSVATGKLQKATSVMEKVGSLGAVGSVDRTGIVARLKGDLLATERMRRLNQGA